MSYISKYYVYKGNKKYQYYRLSQSHKFIRHLGKVFPGDFPKQNIKAIITLKNRALDAMHSVYHFGEEKRLLSELAHREELSEKLADKEFKSYHSFNPSKIEDKDFRKQFESNKKHVDEIEEANNVRIKDIKQALKQLELDKKEVLELKKLQDKAIKEGSWKVRTYMAKLKDCPSTFIKNVQLKYHKTDIQKSVKFGKDEKTGFNLVTGQNGVLHIPSYNARELKDMQYVNTKLGYKAFHKKQINVLYENIGEEAYKNLLTDEVKNHYAKILGYKTGNYLKRNFKKDFAAYMHGKLKKSDNPKDQLKQKVFDAMNTRSWKDEDMEMKRSWRTSIQDPSVNLTKAQRHKLGEVNQVKPDNDEITSLNKAILKITKGGKK